MPIDRINRKFFLMAVNGQRIGKNTDNDIAVRCPICGDSKKNKRATRLHLYTKDGYDGDQVSCFNGDCPCHNKTVYSFIKEFYPALFEQFKRENFSNTMETLANGGDVFGQFNKSDDASKSDSFDEWGEESYSPVLHHDLTPYLKDISEVPEAIAYLKNRGIHYDETLYGKWYFGYQDLKIGETLYKITNAIVIPFYCNGEMYGFYSRSIKDKTFYTYNPDQNVGYKIWNWFNINPDEPVYIFEGIFDAISSGLDNIIALTSAQLPDERLKEIDNPVFVLDNDRTGLMNSIKYAERGSLVYIQPDDITQKDMNELMINNSELDIPDLINNNLYTGISAVVRIKSKL